MHLVIVSPFPPSITGIGQYGYHLTRALANSGLFSRLTVLAGAHPQQGRHPNHLGHTEIDYCWQPDSLRARQAILSRIKQLHPDLIWFNLGASIFGKSPLSNLSGLLTPMSASRLFPTVVTLHELVELADLRTLNAPGGALAPLGARLLTRIATQADVICLTMQHYAEWLSARGVDCAHIPIGAYHEPELLEETESCELLFFTTLAPYKGLELLIEAFTRLRTETRTLRLTIAGTAHTRFPNYADELRDRFSEAQGIRWLGQVSEDRVRDLFRGAQIVVLPYAASTGSSSVLYQAATWGRAVVASDLSEIRKLALETNLRVQFFENNNVESLCNSLRQLIHSPAVRRLQSQHNFHAIQHLRPKATCHRYVQVFNRALEKRQSTKRIPLMESA
ncbi:MAG TPA: glycosyltransferase family 4 protein [Anaerolineales bacterium]|nr:glycosyltransferase family 4 protein [Anaerolineales bacterium]